MTAITTASANARSARARMYRQLKAHPVVVPLAVGLVMYALVTLASAVFDPGPIPWAHNVIGPAVVMVVAWGQSMVLGGRGK